MRASPAEVAKTEAGCGGTKGKRKRRGFFYVESPFLGAKEEKREESKGKQAKGVRSGLPLPRCRENTEEEERRGFFPFLLSSFHLLICPFFPSPFLDRPSVPSFRQARIERGGLGRLVSFLARSLALALLPGCYDEDDGGGVAILSFFRLMLGATGERHVKSKG